MDVLAMCSGPLIDELLVIENAAVPRPSATIIATWKIIRFRLSLERGLVGGGKSDSRILRREDQI